MIIFATGDQHWAELIAKEMPSSLDFGPAQTLYEVTASGKFEMCKYISTRVTFICKILEILKGLSISLKFWLKICGKLVSDLL